MTRTPRVLIPVYESIGGGMSALGTRRLEMGRALSTACEVTFLTRSAANDPVPGARVVHARSASEQRALVANTDFLYSLSAFPRDLISIARSRAKFILDIYAPVAFECLEAYPDMPIRLLSRIHRRNVAWMSAQLRVADLLICSSSYQRDFWLGACNQMGLLEAETSRRDPTFSSRLVVVPYGVDAARPPEARGTPLRDLVGLGPDSFVFLWSSRILAWHEPETLLRAMARLLPEDPQIHLVFLGLGAGEKSGREAWFDASALRTREARAMAASLGITGRNVHFVDQRIDYREMPAFYADADAATTTFPDSLESEMCLGTRMSDYLWAGLPIATTGCELQRQFTDGQGIGFCAAPGDVDGLVEAMRKIRASGGKRGWSEAAIARARRAYAWSTLIDPVAQWCRENVGSPRARRSAIWAAGKVAGYVAREAGIRWAR